MKPMSTVTMAPADSAESASKSRGHLLATGIASVIVVEFAVGAVSWYVVQPGESLLGPTALSFTVMCFAAATWYSVLRRRVESGVGRNFWLVMAPLCVLAPLWTFVGVLQVSLRVDSSAARTAHALIATRSTTCNIVTVGSVGLLRAPYEVCAKEYPGYGYRVDFTTLDESRGYAYIQGRSNVSWFPNQCATHLFGEWWVFNISVNTSVASCPMGYPENGAG